MTDPEGPLYLPDPLASADLEVECGCVFGYLHGPACSEQRTGRVEIPEPAWLVAGRERARKARLTPDLIDVLSRAKEKATMTKPKPEDVLGKIIRDIEEEIARLERTRSELLTIHTEGRT